MHELYVDGWAGSELGARMEARARMGLDGPMGGGRPAGPAAPGPAAARDAAAASPLDVVRSVIKDGKVDASERTVFESAASRTIVKDEQKRLVDAIQRTRSTTRRASEHEQRVHDLAASRPTHGLDVLDREIQLLEQSGTTFGVEALREQRALRAAEEAKVAQVTQQKLALVGALEAEKLQLADVSVADAKDDYKALRADAQRWIEQFNANGGQFYEGNDLFGDDWDASEVDFDRLAERFHGDPDKLAQFALVQGRTDSAGGSDRAGMEQHFADVARESPEEARRIALRYQAAVELQGIMQRYSEARSAQEGNAGRAAQIDAEIASLNGQIELERQALSPETLAKLPNGPGATAPSVPDAVPGMPGMPSSPAPEVPSTPPHDAPAGPGVPPQVGTPPSPDVRPVPVDYTAPDMRAKLIAMAQAKELLPKGTVEFDASGAAVYTVEPGDSYWRIADRSDGADRFDVARMRELVRVNSELLGRDPGTGLIHPGEQVVLPDRDLATLIQLLGLATQQSDAEPGRDEVGLPETR